MEYFELTNNNKIPVIGMGTGWMNTGYYHPKYFIKRVLQELKQRIIGKYSKENNYTVSYELNKLRHFEGSMITSKEMGYELYDTAFSYNNCDLMGKGLNFPRDRKDVYIISKCSNKDQRNNSVLEEFENTLRDMNTDYIDLYLIHWPQTGTFIDTWKVLEKLYKEGKVNAIGVSNFHIHHLEEIKKSCEIMPMVNELECHPLLQQKEIREYCKRNGIQIIAHTSTGKMRSNITNSILKDIADVHNKTIAQVILRWHYQLGDVSICNTLNQRHMKENLNIFDFVLTDEEMKKIENMDCNFRIWPNPDNADFTKL